MRSNFSWHGRFTPEFVTASQIELSGIRPFGIISPMPACAARHKKPDESV